MVSLLKTGQAYHHYQYTLAPFSISQEHPFYSQYSPIQESNYRAFQIKLESLEIYPGITLMLAVDY